MIEDISQERLEKYQIKNKLADGCHGAVKLATSYRGSPVVVKKISKKDVDSIWVKNEIKAGEILNKQRGVVKFREHLEDEENDYVILEYIDGKDLLQFMEARQFKPLSEKKAKKIIKQLLKTLRICHQLKICHLDLKLENIMVNSKMKTTLIDFGFCVFKTEDEKTTKWVGTPDYAAPEIILKRPYCAFKADIYSIGVVLFCLLTGILPFDLKKKCDTLYKGLKPSISWDYIKPKLSESCKDLLNKMLEADPDERLDINSVIKHKWFKKNLFNL